MDKNNPFGVCLEPECHDNTQMPSAADMAKNLAGSIKDIVGGALAGDGLLVSDEIKQERLNICNECPLFDKASTRCSQCGCFMNVKTGFVATKCPIGKW